MSVSLRRATLDDAHAIHALISAHVGENRLLPRTLPNIRKTIDSWVVAQDGDKPVGCGALASFSSDLCEVRSLVVESSYRGDGLGGKIVRSLIGMAEERRVKTVFTLTTAASFFERQGFVVTTRRNFPLKIYRDCLKCPVKFRCDEVTMVYKTAGHSA